MMDATTLKEKMQKIIEYYQPYGSTIIKVKDKIIFEDYFGWETKDKSPITKDTLYNIELQSKFLLTLATMKLVEQKLLKLNTKLSTLLNLTGEVGQLSVRKILLCKDQLLDFNSQRLQEMNRDEEYQKLDPIEKKLQDFCLTARQITDQEYHNFLAQQPLKGVVDIDTDCRRYILKQIIQKITKKDFFDYLQEDIFSKLDITIYRNFNYQVANYTSRFSDSKMRLITLKDPLVATIGLKMGDLAKFLEAFFHGTIINEESLKFLGPKRHNFGLLIDYEKGFYGVQMEFLTTTFQGYYNKQQDTLLILALNHKGLLIPGPVNDESYIGDLLRLVNEYNFQYSHPTLVPLTSKWIHSAIEIELKPEQYRYVCNGAATIAWCSVYAKNKLMVLVDNEIAVGLCSLYQDKTKNYYSIDSVMVDKKYQNLGYGKQIIQQSLAILQKKGCKVINIGVSMENIAAYHIYLNAGFKIKNMDAWGYDLVWEDSYLASPIPGLAKLNDQ